MKGEEKCQREGGRTRKEGVVQGARDCGRNLCARSPGNLKECSEELRTVSSFLASTISPADEENFSEPSPGVRLQRS